MFTTEVWQATLVSILSPDHRGFELNPEKPEAGLVTGCSVEGLEGIMKVRQHPRNRRILQPRPLDDPFAGGPSGELFIDARHEPELSSEQLIEIHPIHSGAGTLAGQECMGVEIEGVSWPRYRSGFAQREEAQPDDDCES